MKLFMLQNPFLFLTQRCNRLLLQLQKLIYSNNNYIDITCSIINIQMF